MELVQEPLPMAFIRAVKNNPKIPFASPDKAASFVARPSLWEMKKGRRTGPSGLVRTGWKPAKNGPTGLPDSM